MKIKAYLALLVILGVMGTAFFSSAASPDQTYNTLFQVSTYNDLAGGGYDGDTTIGELKKHGDTGLGTFNGLNGEMIVLNGTVYQVRNDGTVQVMDDSKKTPFTMVTFFTPDKLLILNETMNVSQFESELDESLPNKNMFYAIIVEGEFQDLKVRSEPEQTKPYPPLSEALKNQTVFELHQVNGTMMGFWCPENAQSVNNPGYHFHFLSLDKNQGGHVLSFEIEKGVIELDYLSNLDMA